MLLVWVSPLAGQEIEVGDSGRIRLFMNRSCRADTLSPGRFSAHADYGLNSSLYNGLNSANTSLKGNFLLSHALTSYWRADLTSHVTFSGSFFHRLGVQYYFDSLACINPDENTLRIRLETRIRKILGFAFDSDVSTALFNKFETVCDDSGHLVRILRSAFMTPMVSNIAMGFTINVSQTGSLLLGISGARVTLVRDPRVFEGPGVDIFYGVSRGKHALFEYGLSMKLLLDRTFNRFFRWNGDLLLFKKFNHPWDLNLRNSFEFRLARYFLLSVRTRVVYESAVSNHFRFESLVSAGFSVTF